MKLLYGQFESISIRIAYADEFRGFRKGLGFYQKYLPPRNVCLGENDGLQKRLRVRDERVNVRERQRQIVRDRVSTRRDAECVEEGTGAPFTPRNKATNVNRDTRARVSH